MLLIFLVLIVVVLTAAFVWREPELRRRFLAWVLRGQGLVRAAFGLFSPRDLQRQALARIKEQSKVSIGYAHLPTDIVVLLNPEDLERLGATREHVASELAEQISELAGANAGGSVVYLLGARPQVKLEADGQVQAGTVEIRAAWLEGTVAVTALMSAADEVPPSAPGPRLRIEAEGAEPCEVALAGRMTLGRAPRSDVPINNPGVSREHAVLVVEGPLEVTITDLNSVNGIELPGTGRIPGGKPLTIRAGEAFQFGRHVRLELVSDETELMPTGQEQGVGD